MRTVCEQTVSRTALPETGAPRTGSARRGSWERRSRTPDYPPPRARFAQVRMGLAVQGCPPWSPEAARVGSQRRSRHSTIAHRQDRWRRRPATMVHRQVHGTACRAPAGPARRAAAGRPTAQPLRLAARHCQVPAGRGVRCRRRIADHRPRGAAGWSPSSARQRVSHHQLQKGARSPHCSCAR
jgi:hypothetical protein